MLTNHSRTYSIYDDNDFIHNYYERLVLEEILRQSHRVKEGDREFMADVACVALNRLPARYIRHDVDTTFFMSPKDREDTEEKITSAVTDALAYVEGRESAIGFDTSAKEESSGKAIESSDGNSTTNPPRTEKNSIKNGKTATAKNSDKKAKK